MSITFCQSESNNIDIFKVRGTNLDELLIWFNIGAMNEKKDFHGVVHLTEHLISNIYYKGIYFSDFLSQKNIKLEMRTGLDSMYIYLVSPLGKIADNFREIFEYLILGSISEVELFKEKRIIHKEKISRKFDRLKVYQDELNGLIWSKELNIDILGKNLTNITLEDVLKTRGNLFLPSNMKLYFSGEVSDKSIEDTLDGLLLNQENIDESPICCQSNLVDYFKTGNNSKVLDSNPGVMVSLSYLFDEALCEKESIILSLLCLLMVNGTSGFLFDNLRKKLADLYFIVARAYYYFDTPIFEVQYIDSKDNLKNVSEINEFILGIFRSSEFSKYTKLYLETCKTELTNIINCQVNSGSMKIFFIYLAKEHQIGRSHIVLESTLELIDSITSEDISHFLDKISSRNFSIAILK
ncbi:insulinase family protein [Streptococcus pseudopneumoniae]|uniref:insulinase family protein n=1 Tax=Streptococcus pseudopneumoniae TaxID=257758 RepID=UPI0018B0E8E8|nr:insulinase family protein [Streptococcus pseudopneumoniae]MBF9670476.1 insulinase family protein [Streptococcus pseudopneumoniae]